MLNAQKSDEANIYGLYLKGLSCRSGGCMREQEKEVRHYLANRVMQKYNNNELSIMLFFLIFQGFIKHSWERFSRSRFGINRTLACSL